MQDARRTQLAEFLKSCRARVSPAEVGLPSGKRRRTPGLRREDVAALAGVSATWYTWLEQGRDVHPSDRVLEGLARTLQLTSEERDYLFSLAQHRSAPLKPGETEEVSAAVRHTLDALNLPAIVMNLRWDVLYWNAMMARAIRDYGAMPPGERNLIKILLLNPDIRTDHKEYEVTARRVLSKLRMDYGQAGDDPDFDAFIEEMNGLSATFREMWKSPEITGHSEGVHVERHPKQGDITFAHSSYVVEGAPTQRVVIYAAADPDSADKLAKLID
ncbi:MAG: helix-turn-helix domain-containing protein [Hyphomonadaceae bacterium]|nr:helix-turn-helix domain-containing protein [Hyphomonadaceae bacterium]